MNYFSFVAVGPIVIRCVGIDFINTRGRRVATPVVSLSPLRFNLSTFIR